MINDFFKNSAIYGIGKIAALAIGFFTIPIITTALSPADYGVFDLLNLCLVLLNMSVAMEISQAIIRFMVDTKDKHEKRDYVSTAYLFSLIMFTICGLGIYFFAPHISQLIFNDSDYEGFLLYLIPWLYLHGTNTFILNQFRWENKPKTQVTLQTFMSISNLACIIYFLELTEPSLENLIHAYLLSQCLTLIIGSVYIFKNQLIGLSFSLKKLKAMLFFSLPLVPSSIAVFAQNYIDRIMISQMLDLGSLGIYALAFKVAALSSAFIGVFHLSIVPLIYKHHKDESASKNFGEAAQIFLFFILSCVLGISLFTPELFHFVIGDEFEKSTHIVTLLLLAIGFQSFYVFAPGLALKSKTHYIAIISLIGMLINFIFNVALIQIYGLIGAAIATLATAILICILNIAINQKYYFVVYGYGRIFLGLTVFLIPLFYFYFLNAGISIELFIVKTITYIITILILTYILILKNIDASSLKKLKNFRQM